MVKIGMVDLKPHGNWPSIKVGPYLIHLGRYFWCQSKSGMEVRCYLKFIWVIKVL